VAVRSQGKNNEITMRVFQKEDHALSLKLGVASALKVVVSIRAGLKPYYIAGRRL
jgi:hypothetical protein